MRIATRIVLALAVSVLACGYAQAGSITVYSALENDKISICLAAARHPGACLRLSTGDLAARLIAESAAPRNDVFFG
jgi:iron(III) transport system substrate-binding protein